MLKNGLIVTYSIIKIHSGKIGEASPGTKVSSILYSLLLKLKSNLYDLRDITSVYMLSLCFWFLSMQGFLLCILASCTARSAKNASDWSFSDLLSDSQSCTSYPASFGDIPIVAMDVVSNM